MKPIVILGIFVADTAYRAERQPKMGETILGTSFVLGPGGKGSNQSVAAAMAGGRVHFITRLGADAFAEIAQATWAKAGVKPEGKWIYAEGADASSNGRSIPLDKALDDVMVAFFANGEALRKEHGYPVRLVVPGWEGNMWVKWLRRERAPLGATSPRRQGS